MDQRPAAEARRCVNREAVREQGGGAGLSWQEGLSCCFELELSSAVVAVELSSAVVAVELSSAVVAVDPVFVTFCPTTVEPGSCNVHKFALHFRVRCHLNICFFWW